jgi:hypothetical protein
VVPLVVNDHVNTRVEAASNVRADRGEKALRFKEGTLTRDHILARLSSDGAPRLTMVFQPVKLGDQVVVGESWGTVSAKNVNVSLHLSENCLRGGVDLNHRWVFKILLQGITVEVAAPEDHLLRVFVSRGDNQMLMKSLCEEFERGWREANLSTSLSEACLKQSHNLICPSTGSVLLVNEGLATLAHTSESNGRIGGEAELCALLAKFV